jgi:sulfonate transport system substrate-binding protein
MPRELNRGEGRAFVGLGIFVVASTALLWAFAPVRRHASHDRLLPLTAALPDKVPPGVTLVVGDPISQWVFEHNGWDKQLPFRIRWAQITGGPQVTEAFHARALDVGLGANVPPIHAVWVGMPVKILAFRERADPVANPTYVLGLSPKSGVGSLADLRGKRIAFSPSQIQSQIVLQTLQAEGLKTSDVKLVELPSSIGGDVYTTSLASNVVDVAPLGSGVIAAKYLRKFAAVGARILPHPPFRDDGIAVYTPVAVLQDPAKAAALRIFIRYWGMSQAWQQAHKDELAQGYYVQHQGVKPPDAKLIQKAAGDLVVLKDWRGAVAYQQATIDLMAPQMGHAKFDAATLFDYRFEHLAADAVASPLAANVPPRGADSSKGGVQ